MAGNTYKLILLLLHLLLLSNIHTSTNVAGKSAIIQVLRVAGAYYPARCTIAMSYPKQAFMKLAVIKITQKLVGSYLCVFLYKGLEPARAQMFFQLAAGPVYPYLIHIGYATT